MCAMGARTTTYFALQKPQTKSYPMRKKGEKNVTEIFKLYHAQEKKLKREEEECVCVQNKHKA